MRKGLNLNFNKKGNMITDSLFVVFVTSVLIFVVVIGVNILQDVNSDVQADSDIGTDAKNSLGGITASAPSLFDYGIGLAFALLWIMVIIFSFYIDSHPVFFGVSFILLLVVIMIANGIGDGLTDFIADGDLISTTSSMPILTFISQHLTTLIVAVGVTIALALYAKTTQNG